MLHCVILINSSFCAFYGVHVAQFKLQPQHIGAGLGPYFRSLSAPFLTRPWERAGKWRPEAN